MLRCSRVARRIAATTATTTTTPRRRGRGVTFGRRGVCALPHPAKAHRGGEDAYFAHAYGVGVADGVGGYAAHGVDPAQYTRQLMRHALQALDAATSPSTRAAAHTPPSSLPVAPQQKRQHDTQDAAADDEDEDVVVRGIDALTLLQGSVRRVAQQRQPGGCPVVVVTLVDGHVASLLNLGDCGVLLLQRGGGGGKLLYRSTAQQHAFNCPYQLPDDAPEAGERARVEVCDGDVLLCASDGVFDNVDDDELRAQLLAVDGVGCARTAHAIAQLASRYARSRTRMTPFAQHAREAGYAHDGGKLDDITALVARVTTASDVTQHDDDVCPSLITELLHLPD